MLDLIELLRIVVEHEGSDLHIKVGSPPQVRVNGRLVATRMPVVTANDTEQIAFSILPKDRADEFCHTHEADFALGVSQLGRFRVNVHRQRGSVGLVLRRVLPISTPSFESLLLPNVLTQLADAERGLVVVTGPASAGKTTTVAAIIDHINSSRPVSIVTVEDPIEVLHPDKRAIVAQREIGTDTHDYATALRRVLRQDPDVVFVSELLDPDTVSGALQAAQSGCLVLTTMQTTGAADTIGRIVEMFPPHRQPQVRQTLASTLQGVISQRLLPRVDGDGRVPACELLVGSTRVVDAIVDGASAAVLEDLMAEGDYHGMQTFDQSVMQLCKDGLIDGRTAVAGAGHPQAVRLELETAGLYS